MTNTDNELNEQLLRKLGWKRDGKTWLMPNGKHYYNREPGLVSHIDLTTDLASCFKFLLPELRKHGCTKVAFYYSQRDTVWCELTCRDRSGKHTEVRVNAESEAMALCRAANIVLSRRE